VLVRLLADRQWPPGSPVLPAGSLLAVSDEEADGLIFEGAAEPATQGENQENR
jgi:hypothetical protein